MDHQIKDNTYRIIRCLKIWRPFKNLMIGLRYNIYRCLKIKLRFSSNPSLWLYLMSKTQWSLKSSHSPKIPHKRLTIHSAFVKKANQSFNFSQNKRALVIYKRNCKRRSEASSRAMSHRSKDKIQLLLNKLQLKLIIYIIKKNHWK